MRTGKKQKWSSPQILRYKVIDTLQESAFEASEQADAAVVDVVNAIRITQLLKKLTVIDRNQAGADHEIRLLKAEIKKLLTTHRGGRDGMHGLLGETSQVRIANIR